MPFYTQLLTIKTCIWTLEILVIIYNMAIRVVEFLNGGTKLERFLPKNQHTHRKLLNFENWVNGEVSKSVKNYPNLFHFFSHRRISIQEHILCYWLF